MSNRWQRRRQARRRPKRPARTRGGVGGWVAAGVLVLAAVAIGIARAL